MGTHTENREAAGGDAPWHDRPRRARDRRFGRGGRRRPGSDPGLSDFQEHLPELVSMAWFLLDDPVLVTEAMVCSVRAFLDGRVPTGGGRHDDQAALATVVYRCCTDASGWAGTPARREAAEPSSGPRPRRDELSSLERAALALVAMGGHVYTDAADILGVEPTSVAVWLRSGLRRLAPAGEGAESARPPMRATGSRPRPIGEGEEAG